VYVMCPIIKNLCTMKVQLSPITKYVHATALLSNIDTCLEAYQNDTHFDCIRPTLNDFFDIHARLLHVQCI